MIAGGDDVAKSAFRVALREHPSSPSLISTQELDPADILEVHDVAEAIARAEALVRTPAPSRSGDLFEALVRRPTDDASGPAQAAPARTSSVPPPPGAEQARTEEVAALGNLQAVDALEAAGDTVPETQRSATAQPPARVLHVPIAEEDAYYHPGGRIRGLAEMTLDGYRPEPTLLVRIRERRTRFTWWVAGTVVALTALVVAAAWPTAPGAASAPAALGHATTKAPVAGPAALAAPPATAVTAATSAATKSDRTSGPSEPDVPVFDVKALPKAH